MQYILHTDLDGLWGDYCELLLKLIPTKEEVGTEVEWSTFIIFNLINHHGALFIISFHHPLSYLIISPHIRSSTIAFHHPRSHSIIRNLNPSFAITFNHPRYLTFAVTQLTELSSHGHEYDRLGEAEQFMFHVSSCDLLLTYHHCIERLRDDHILNSWIFNSQKVDPLLMYQVSWITF